MKMPKSLTEGRIHGIKYLERYPLLDSKNNKAVIGLEGRYFDAKLHYNIVGEEQSAVPVEREGLFAVAFGGYDKPMSQELARKWILDALKKSVDPIPSEYIRLEELVLGNEGEQGITHTLRAKGRVYCITRTDKIEVK